MLSVTLPARNRLAVAKINELFFWKSAPGSSLFDVLATFDRLATAIAEIGTERSPMV